jgi:quercetin dioxygenase-like cupin family protein
LQVLNPPTLNICELSGNIVVDLIDIPCQVNFRIQLNPGVFYWACTFAPKGVKMPVKKLSEIKAVNVKDGVGVTRKNLITPEEAPNFSMRHFRIEPGGSMPLHTNLVEHEQFVLTGHGRICIGDEEFVVKKGNIVYIPAEVPHCYTNIGDEPFEFLCLVPVGEDSVKVLS